MFPLATLFRVLVAIHRLITTLWSACFVFLQVVRSVVQEARQEAAELVTLLDDSAPVTDAIALGALLQGAGGLAPWQMLIIARASSFVLLLRLSAQRVLHLEVDENFITSRLEVIRTGLALHVQHIPRLLQMSIGTHDTRLVRYTPLKLPYVWKEEQTDPHSGTGTEGVVVGSTTVSAAPAPSISTDGEGRAHRKKYVQMLTESTLRRRLHMDRLVRTGADGAMKKATSVSKIHGETTVKRKALSNATNVGTAHTDGGTDADTLSDEMHGREVGVGVGVVDTPTRKPARLERSIRASLGENMNMSLPNLVQASSGRKSAEGVPQLRRSGRQSLRRKRGEFDLYAQGVSSEFSLVSKTDQGA